MIHTLFITLAIYAVVAFLALLIRKHTAQWSEMDYDEPPKKPEESLPSQQLSQSTDL